MISLAPGDLQKPRHSSMSHVDPFSEPKMDYLDQFSASAAPVRGVTFALGFSGTAAPTTERLCMRDC